MVHKVQGFILIGFDLQKPKSFGPGKIYTMLSRVKTYSNFYSIREFTISAIKVNKDALLEYKILN